MVERTGTLYRMQEVTFAATEAPGVDVERARSTSEAGRLIGPLLPHDGREHFVELLLDGHHRVLGWYRVAIGGLHDVHVKPREVYAAALRVVGCAQIIVAHNHPTGDTAPSPADLKLTRDLIKAGTLLGIRLVDHLIFANGTDRYLSLARTGVIK